MRSWGHDVVRVSEALVATAADSYIIEFAAAEGRSIRTQDLDFCAIIALSGRSSPSVLSLRLSCSRVEHMNEVLAGILPLADAPLGRSAILGVEGNRIHGRSLPIR